MMVMVIMLVMVTMIIIMIIDYDIDNDGDYDYDVKREVCRNYTASTIESKSRDILALYAFVHETYVPSAL